MAHRFFWLCSRLIPFWIVVRWLRLIAQNVAELFSSNNNVSHFYAACCINDVSWGSVLGLFWVPKLFSVFGSSTVRKLGKSCDLLVFLCFIWNCQPWRPPGQYGVGTCPLAASSGFAWSHECAPLGNVHCPVSPQLHGDQNRRQFACIFGNRRFHCCP